MWVCIPASNEEILIIIESFKSSSKTLHIHIYLNNLDSIQIRDRKLEQFKLIVGTGGWTQPHAHILKFNVS